MTLSTEQAKHVRQTS